MYVTVKRLSLTPVIFHTLILICFTSREVSTELFTIDLDPFWELFKKLYAKGYSDEEEEMRRMLWEKKLLGIFLHNLKADMGLTNSRRGLNAYSDYSPEEIEKYLKGFKDPGYKGNSTHFIKPSHAEAPDSVDWRDEGLVTDVKNQGQCGACWAFSAVGALEGQHMKKTSHLISLSAQQLLDCSTNGVNNGCDGGIMSAAFDHIKDSEGVDTAKSYPYREEQGECNFQPKTMAATCTGFVNLPEGDENALKDAVATTGPICAAIDSSHDSFLNYKSGIWDEPFCSNTQYDHAILIIGYGTEDGTDYWLIKNSWGESWGMKGYMKMARNKNNMCGIANKASYPLV